ncbi:MAG TPA: FliM/FliN family flagellar motor switch protein [Candidatus Binataceae bacterium]
MAEIATEVAHTAPPARPATPAPPAAETYELWRPIIRPERRAALVRLHQNVAVSWNQALAEFLPHGARIEFEGLGFESFARLSAVDSRISHNTIFAIERTEIGGFLLLSAELARSLVETRLGMGTAHDDANAQTPLTRVEAAIMREALKTMVERLGDAYLAAGVGKIIVTRHSDQLKDTMLFSPEDYLVVLRFRIGAASSSLRAMVAVGSGIINLARNFAVADEVGRGSVRVARAAASLPVDVDLVLGTWSVSLDDLAGLKEGDMIVLPGGEDASLETGGVQIRRAWATLAGRRIEIDIIAAESENGHE